MMSSPEEFYEYSISYGRVKNIKTNIIINGDINNAGYRRIWLYVPIKKTIFYS